MKNNKYIKNERIEDKLKDVDRFWDEIMEDEHLREGLKGLAKK